MAEGREALHGKKKVHEFPVSSRDVTNQTPPGQELFSYDVIIPARGEFGSDIPAGDGKLAILFFNGVWGSSLFQGSISMDFFQSSYFKGYTMLSIKYKYTSADKRVFGIFGSGKLAD